VRVLKALAVAYLAAILTLTLWPNLQHTDVPRWAHGILQFANSHGVPLTFDVLEGVANVLMFVPLGLLGIWLLGDWREMIHHDSRIVARPSLVGIVVQITLLGAALSGLIEVGQLLVPGRVTSFDDFWRNSLGALLGALLGVATLAVHLRRERRAALAAELALGNDG